LTGPNAAGKGEAAAHLAKRGFSIHSLSDVVREAARDRGFPPEREHLIRIGNDLRREDGPGVLAQRLLPRLVGRSVADSIRNPAEVEVLREGLERFVLVGIEASPEARFRRIVARGRPGDPRTMKEFEERERQENASDPNSQQLSATFRMADVVVDNSGTLEDLAARIDRVLIRAGVAVEEPAD
jgi:dephospho-CoA kinase